jgi:ABC-type uncharacterized transport system involved in gliding motility auxiliary subunit
MGMRQPPFAMPGQPPPQPQPAWFAFEDLGKDYEVRELAGEIEGIDEDVDALLLVHPRDLSEKTLFAIDQFVLRGGRLAVFLDPLCMTQIETQRMTPQQRFAGAASNLPKLLDAWGVSYEPAKVVADLESSSRLRAGDGSVQDSPVWLSLRRNNFSARDVLTSRLEAVMMPYAGAFEVSAPEGVEVENLISTSETSGMVDAMTAQFSVDGVRRAFKSGLKRLHLAVRLHGKLRTAFPDGPPEEEAAASDGEEPDDEEEADAEEPGWLTASADTSTVVLVGDVDMLYDRFCVRSMSFMGFQAHQPMNDNLAFFFNTAEQLAGSTELVGIRTRGKTARPFHVVLELERRAQQEYTAEETRLQEKLNEAQQRLGELQRQKDQTQKYILSPEQKEEIDNFRKQVAKTRQELKLVRRKLRRDIEQLGMRLKVFNILLMPLCVAGTGVGFFFYRRKRQVS